MPLTKLFQQLIFPSKYKIVKSKEGYFTANKNNTYKLYRRNFPIILLFDVCFFFHLLVILFSSFAVLRALNSCFLGIVIGNILFNEKAKYKLVCENFYSIEEAIARIEELEYDDPLDPDVTYL